MVRLIRSTLVTVPVSACWAKAAELMMVRAAVPAIHKDLCDFHGSLPVYEICAIMIRKLSSLRLRKKGQQAYQVAASNWAGEGTSSTWPVHSVVRRMIDTEMSGVGKADKCAKPRATLPLVRGYLLPIAIALLGRAAIIV